MSRFSTKALDYSSHTLIILRDHHHRLFGGFVAEEWKLSGPGLFFSLSFLPLFLFVLFSSFFCFYIYCLTAATRRFHENAACKECFLFSLQPVYQKLPATGVSHHHFMLMCDSLTKSTYISLSLSLLLSLPLSSSLPLSLSSLTLSLSVFTLFLFSFSPFVLLFLLFFLFLCLLSLIFRLSCSLLYLLMKWKVGEIRN